MTDDHCKHKSFESLMVLDFCEGDPICEDCGIPYSDALAIERTKYESDLMRESESGQLNTNTDYGNFSDGYHTFNELYEFRKVYNAALFNAWHKQGLYNIHKSTRHHDGEECFGGGWFIVVAMLPTGQISNHYEMKDWDLFDIPACDTALFEFDGHTSRDVINRILAL